MNKRLLIANVMDKVGASSALLKMRRAMGTPWLPVVTFHRVLDRTSQPDYLYDDGVVDAGPAEFERHIQTISRYFNPIGVDDLVASFDGAPLPKNPIIVSFDDGYKDNLDVALPILKRHAVKAVFFIATHYITHRRMFWWDRINYIVKRCRQERLRIDGPVEHELALSTPAEREAAIRTLLRTVKTHVGLDLESFLDRLGAAANVRWTDQIDRDFAASTLMTWDDVREMRRAGMDIQSHTRTHRVLQTLTATDLRDELAGSRQDLEREMNEPISSISYPVGHRLEDRQDVRDALLAAGYKLGFTNATGTYRMRSKADPFDVNRIGVDYGTPDALFRAMLAAPSLFD